MHELKLEPLCAVEVRVGTSLDIGEGALGRRSIGVISGCDVRGERLSGTLEGPAAADWMLLHGTVGAIDVRMTIRTDDGALVYMSYTGKLDLADREGGLKTFVAPAFESGDERYRWLNAVQGVGKGIISAAPDGGSTISYQFFVMR